MADKNPASDGPRTDQEDAFKFELLPDFDNDFVNEPDIQAFVNALAAPDNDSSKSPVLDDPSSADGYFQHDPRNHPKQFITALNDWRPIHQRVKRRPGTAPKKRRRKPRRGKDETREGFVYTLLKWPLLASVMTWIIVLGAGYFATRIYIYLYEHFFIMVGARERLRKRLNSSTSYAEWVEAAEAMDRYLGNDKWRASDDYAYYNSSIVREVRDSLRSLRRRHEQGQKARADVRPMLDEIRSLIEASVKNNFVGVENPRLYSETYVGTKTLVQSFIDEVEQSMKTLVDTPGLNGEQKTSLFRHLHTNYGRTALCLSGGATFAYYHLGVAKALLDADTLPQVITGTSGGALVAALLGTRTDDELKRLLVPALANRITACSDPLAVWIRRWWLTGARFDSVDWARRCAWFCRGSLTFREAYERTGRILNVTCVPSDPHSPTILANYKTSPDCVIWSAVLASAAVPGILNPVVLMRKRSDGTLAPHSFGHKWKDGSLRTDIPLKALNTHFNVSFSIVSQVNPHINLFFFSSRGTVGRPVTHRRGRGWRGGFLGSATEQYLKLDLTKWLKVLRHLELLPRYANQDWSEVWLQRFSGTVTIWPKSIPSDFVNILSDPSVERLARMIHVGQLSCFPKLKFIGNRMKIERLIESGRRLTSPDGAIEEDIRDEPATPGVMTPGARPWPDSALDATDSRPRARTRPGLVRGILSEEDLRGLLNRARSEGFVRVEDALSQSQPERRLESPSLSKRLTGWFVGSSPKSTLQTGANEVGGPAAGNDEDSISSVVAPQSLLEVAGDAEAPRRGSTLEELERQTRVFFDDETDLDLEGSGSEVDTAESVGEDDGIEAPYERAPVVEKIDADEVEGPSAQMIDLNKF